METLTPRVQEQLKRVGPKAAAPIPVQTGRPASRTWLWIGAFAALVATGIAGWRTLQASREEESAPTI
ncbi:MAG: hypothetical protein ACLGH7_09085, partial [Actinomycetes bacterium]